MTDTTTTSKPHVGDRVKFDGKATSWLARAATVDGRYLLLTCAMFGKVYYTIVDFELGIRGPMNVIGWGLDIFTLSGPDPGIDDAIDRLQQTGAWAGRHPGLWRVSHRNRVPLQITAVQPKGTPTLPDSALDDTSSDVAAHTRSDP